MEERKKARRVLGVIPARYGSQRFPGKLLALLAGKTVIQRTYEGVCRCSALDDLIIATDDERIKAHAESFGATAVMTPGHCSSGTERIEALLKVEERYAAYDIIVNIQGDEPCLPAEALSLLVRALQGAPHAAMATLIAPLADEEAWRSPSVVKCICGKDGDALYFSRAPIPGSKAGKWHPSLPVYRHVGVYAYRSSFLLKYSTLKDTPLQLVEDLEQLKVLEHGFSIATALIDDVAVGVDTPEDLKTLEKLLLCNVNISSSPAASAPR